MPGGEARLLIVYRVWLHGKISGWEASLHMFMDARDAIVYLSLLNPTRSPKPMRARIPW